MKKFNKVCVFDFDGTLFNSPLPSRDRLSSVMFGKVISSKLDGGLGWFECLDTLSRENTLDIGIGFIDDVVNAAKQCLSDPDTYTILLTGRSTAFTAQIKDLCSRVGLVFDDYYLKDKSLNENTGEFKIRVLNNILYQSDAFVSIDMWEDRSKHIVLFRDFLSAHKNVLDFSIHEIVREVYTLPEDVERAIVRKLIEESPNVSLQSAKQPNYFGVKIDENSRRDILALFTNIDSTWKILVDHMTILFGAKYKKRPDLYEWLNNNIGIDVVLTIDAYAQDSNAIAVHVSKIVPNIDVESNLPHISVAIASNIKPVYCKTMTYNNELPKPLTVYGHIEAFFDN
jgi:predicted DNA-binding protein YlxM (UPF0122 family)